MKKYLIILLAGLCVSWNIFSQTDFMGNPIKYILSNSELYTGVTINHNEDFAFADAEDITDGRFLTFGYRYNMFNETLCLSFDYGICINPGKFRSNSTKDISADVKIYKFKDRCFFIGADYKFSDISFTYNNAGINQYSLSNLQNLGPYLRYKNRGLNIEIGYTFGLNKKQWNDILKTPDLPKEQVNQFFVKAYLSIPCKNS